MIARARPLRGFTLVELLVVIGTIAVLIGILLPSLARARESARRVGCLSNLRQVHLALAFYAHDNDGRVPLGYRVGRKQFNSMIYSGTSRKITLFGVLQTAGYMVQPEVFFCPAEQDPRSQFDTPENPWPPGKIPTTNIAAGYGGRPDVELPDAPQTLANVTFPRLGDYRNRAILADLVSLPVRVDSRHRLGINALYGDGSAGWVSRERFDDPLSRCLTLNPATNADQDAIWRAMDRTASR